LSGEIEVSSAQLDDGRANGNSAEVDSTIFFFRRGNFMKKLLTLASLSVAMLAGCDKPAPAPAPAPMAAPAPAPAPAAEPAKDAAPMAAPADASKDAKK
jgi:hypothetical protein